MAPKKKQQKHSNKANSSSSKSKPQSSSSGPRLQISAENENRLRRLLLNSDRSTHPASAASVQDNLSKTQKAKRLKNVYEKLSCEGFSNDQIELALTSLKVIMSFYSLHRGKVESFDRKFFIFMSCLCFFYWDQDNATFESALDWLCLNLPGNELPLKFSSGISLHTNQGMFDFYFTE